MCARQNNIQGTMKLPSLSIHKNTQLSNSYLTLHAKARKILMVSKFVYTFL